MEYKMSFLDLRYDEEYAISQKIPAAEYESVTTLWDAEVNYREDIAEVMSFPVEVLRGENGERMRASYFAIYDNGYLDHDNWVDEDSGHYIPVHAQDVWKYIVPDAYLSETESINFGHPLIQKKAEQLKAAASSEMDYIERAYTFVRDEIPHSWDISCETVSRCAGDVLENGTGICWTKSCLLAALLRANGIPAGITYQRLTRADEDDSEGYIIHALNTVFLREEARWIRLDARGNKECVNAQFSVEEERLAFSVRKQLREEDYCVNYPDLDRRLIKILRESRSVLVISADFRMK